MHKSSTLKSASGYCSKYLIVVSKPILASFTCTKKKIGREISGKSIIRTLRPLTQSLNFDFGFWAVFVEESEHVPRKVKRDRIRKAAAAVGYPGK